MCNDKKIASVKLKQFIQFVSKQELTSIFNAVIINSNSSIDVLRMIHNSSELHVIHKTIMWEQLSIAYLNSTSLKTLGDISSRVEI